MNEKDKKLLRIVSINLKEERKRLKISQLELANRCEISQSYLGEIEACRKSPSLKTLNLLADQLGVKPYKLLLDEEIKLQINPNYVYTKIEEELSKRLSNCIDDFFKDHKIV